jgi:hypothetical protein
MGTGIAAFKSSPDGRLFGAPMPEPKDEFRKELWVATVINPPGLDRLMAFIAQFWYITKKTHGSFHYGGCAHEKPRSKL